MAVNTENISSLANISKGDLSNKAKNFTNDLKNKAKDRLKESFNIKKVLSEKEKTITADVETLQADLKKSTEEYVKRKNQILQSNESENIKQEKLNQLDKDFEAEKQLIQDNINTKQTELLDFAKAYTSQEIEKLQNETQTLNDNIIAKRNDTLNGKPKLNTVDIIGKVSLLANVLLSAISIGNKRIEKLVDKVNLQIKNIKTEADIQKAKLSINRAKLIISQNRSRLQTLQIVTQILTILIPLLDSILILFKSNPIPSAVPPGVGVPLGTINTIDSKSKRLDDIKLAATIILGIITQIISKLIADLDYQESRLLPIEGLLDKGLENLTLDELNNINNAGLGYLKGYDYKGFRFFIKEEEDPRFVVKGNKRRYATAVNNDGNDVLKSQASFTLEPDVLIEELKLIIDEKNLVA